MIFRLLSLVLLSYGSALSSLPATTYESRPNIVVLLCDDLGYGDLGCYGHPTIKTPHLDQLASEGMRCTDFYSAAPVCSPSRVGLLTGRTPNRAGVYDWIPPYSGKPAQADRLAYMREGELTVAQLLRKAGYATCLSGKWHCNSRFNHPSQPQPDAFGFDHWFATQNNAAPSHRHPKNFVRDGEPVGPLEGFSCHLVVDEVIGWLEGRRSSEDNKPFFAFVCFHEPHEPIASPIDLVETYLPNSESRTQAEYFANVTNMDRAVGRLMKALKQLGHHEDTLVVFTSDNGPETLRRYRGAERSHGSPGPLRGMKLHTHEAGFRVPGILRWPGRIQAGSECAIPLCSVDFLPTFCALAGSPTPTHRVLDGADIRAVFEGRRPARGKPLFWCYYNALNEAKVALRDGDWKVLARLEGGAFPRLQNVTIAGADALREARLTDFEIYNLARDRAETENLLRRDRRSARLIEMLKQRYREVLAESHFWDPREFGG